MAIPGVEFKLTERDQEQAIKYVEDSGLYKNRLADFLGISRPTLDKVLEDKPDFFTSLKQADARFCKKLIEIVGKKNPFLILSTKYREEFNDTIKIGFDPELEIQRIQKMLNESTTKDLPNI